jgi:hypothetical protein
MSGKIQQLGLEKKMENGENGLILKEKMEKWQRILAEGELEKIKLFN